MTTSVFGGEHYFTFSDLISKKKFNIDSFLKEKYPLKNYTFTGGGYYSLYKIIENIKFAKDDEILFPSYLCPTILIPFKRCNVKYSFYNVNQNLKIDINDIKKKVTSKTKAIFFINYFGFKHTVDFYNLISELKSDGIIIIEDLVQSFFSNHEIVGDYAFNSFRKFLPVDGSVIISNDPIKNEINRHTTRYNIYKGIGQVLRSLTLRFKFLDFTKQFLSLFAKANKEYYKYTSVGMNFFNRYLLSRQNIESMVKNRRELFIKICEELEFNYISPILDKDVIPLGIPIVLNNRNVGHKVLMDRNIFCPIHWDLQHVDEIKCMDSKQLSRSILTLPLSAKITEQTEFINRLRECYGNIS